MIKVKFKRTGEEFYFRFFSEEDESLFWYTKTEDSFGFMIGNIRDFEPIKTDWLHLRAEERLK